MSDFINTIDLVGDDEVAKSIIDGSIAEFNDDALTTIKPYAFAYCPTLTSLNLPSVTNIETNAFRESSKLNLLILGSQSVCTLGSTYTFYNTPFASNGAGGTVYVPQALIEQYQTAINWSTLYAGGTCNFVAIEGSEYE